MPLYERVLLALYSLIIAALTLALVGISAGWSMPLDLYELSLTRLDYRVVGGVAAAVMFFLSLRFFVVSLQTKTPKIEQALIHQGEAGEVTISLPALENLVVRAARQVKGIREVKPRLKILPEGVTVTLEVHVLPDQNLPNMAQNLQETVRNYITDVTGLESPEVRILINGVWQEGIRRVE
ncbi:alkaline shock response membrane anchor protein AmaP [Moorellaceae bacterium AZ2]